MNIVTPPTKASSPRVHAQILRAVPIGLSHPEILLLLLLGLFAAVIAGKEGRRLKWLNNVDHSTSSLC